MPDWIIAVVTSQFVWGTLIGLALSMGGAYMHAEYHFRRNLTLQSRDVLDLCRDLIRNVVKIAEDVEEARRRSKLIHPDLFALFDAEVNIFGRNREHTIRIVDQELRDEIRQYFTKCALRRTEIGVHLANFDRQMRLHDDLQANGNGPEAQRVLNDATSGPLADAHKAMDDFIKVAQTGDPLLDKIGKA